MLVDMLQLQGNGGDKWRWITARCGEILTRKKVGETRQLGNVQVEVEKKLQSRQGGRETLGEVLPGLL